MLLRRHHPDPEPPDDTAPDTETQDAPQAKKAAGRSPSKADKEG